MTRAPVETPKANPEPLFQLMAAAHEAKVVLPEFQRSFIWQRSDIEEFLSSVLQGYFVGSFLLLYTPADNPMFPYRPVEGLETVNPQANAHDHQTVRLVLDGQQRITSMFYALYEPDRPLANATRPYKFFLELEAALDGDIDDAVKGVSTWNRSELSELSRKVQERRALPFPMLRDPSQFYRWLHDPGSLWFGESQRRQVEELFQRIQRFMVPVVSLSAETGAENIVNIFERINRTGRPLSVFDLMTARLYVQDVRLRDCWDAFAEQYEEVAAVIKPELILKAIILLDEGQAPKKAKLLDLGRMDKPTFERFWAIATNAIVAAYRRISHEYGAVGARWVPYSTLLAPLGVLLHQLEAANAVADDYACVDRWYWACVFTQRYDSAVDTKSAQDIRDVMAWIRGGTVPDWIASAAQRELDLTVSESRSALYRGIMCLLVCHGARDLLTGQSPVLAECDDDHLFPRSRHSKHKLCNAILNRTLIWSRTNRKRKSDMPLSEFLKKCLEGHGGDARRLLSTLATHLINHEAYQAAQRDDFDAFVAAREKELRSAIDKCLRGS